MNRETQLNLQAFLDGELPDAEAREVAELIAREPVAKALHDELSQTKSVLAAAEPAYVLPETREFYWSKIARGIEAGGRAGGTEADEEGRAPWFSPAAWLRWLAPAAALAVLVGLLVLPKSGGHSPSYVTYLSHLDEEDAVFTPNSSFTFRSESESMTVVWVQNRWD